MTIIFFIYILSTVHYLFKRKKLSSNSLDVPKFQIKITSTALEKKTNSGPFLEVPRLNKKMWTGQITSFHIEIICSATLI